MTLELDSRLAADCHVLGRLPLCQLLLMNNREIAWLILVPETAHTEVCDLEPELRDELWREVQRVSEFIRWHFAPDKLNVGAIGNVVQQLHVHVIGRRRDDYCWPDVVWGRLADSAYTEADVVAIRAAAEAYLEEIS